MKKKTQLFWSDRCCSCRRADWRRNLYETERDRNLNADTASTAADSNRAEEVQKAVFLAEDSGLWYLGDLEHGNIYVTHTPSDTLYDENGNAIDPSEIKKEIFFKWRATVLC